MKNALIYIFFVLFIIIGCSKPSDDDTQDTPSNLVINTEIVGSNSSNPNGDGSGTVNFTITATNADSYKILIGSDVIETNTGIFTYNFSQLGTNTYTIYVSAYKNSKFISSTISLTVYVAPTLVWSDEFKTNGAPDSSKWGYDIGTGDGGWGNNELEYYTSRAENVIVEDGVLKIKILKEDYLGSSYTSARLLTKNKFDFKYGKIEFRAKLPAGGGTWPALWMLGSDINSVGWPACGEIDVMEHIGNNLNTIYGTLHYPDHSGGNAVGGTTLISNATTEFHIYTAEWNAQNIKFYVDNQLFFTFTNSSSIPFNHNFFIIMNCAIGGNFGGTVDPNFTSATFEIDYVRVYQ